ncbi:permease [Caproiciproducens sp. MSJ-32]|uniref:permease n=1 Tax=Caproiciproducens sp. MSJ-32 TaxID=2841527 RepID=UPI001C1119D0|nr:permease [Caproiciproducens sp. MSJ-32]MBU5454814.1 permease [Caproiciproducens sp. MSJ-32]
MVVYIEKIIITFVNMILEGLPFLLLGSIVSAAIQLFVTEEMIEKVLPKNQIISLLIASIVGIIIPICECAIIPVTKSLIRKKVPIKIAVTFMLAVPIINPIVIMSTYYAFNDIKIALIRFIGGVILSITIGILVDFLVSNNKDIVNRKTEYSDLCECGCLTIDYFTKKSKLRICLEHSIREFLNILKYYIYASFLSSIFICIIDENIFIKIGKGKFISIIIMMLMAFLFSLCSEADAFVAKGFLNHFNIAAISAFLILGPMMDLKNAVIISSYFKKEFTIKLIGTIIICILCFSLLLAAII